MLRLLLTIFLVSAGVFVYSYFRELNPGTVLVRQSQNVEFEISPVTLALISMSIGAVIVAFIVGLQQTAHAINTWQSTRLARRKEKVDALHREGTHAFMSKRTGLFKTQTLMVYLSFGQNPQRSDSHCVFPTMGSGAKQPNPMT